MTPWCVCDVTHTLEQARHRTSITSCSARGSFMCVTCFIRFLTWLIYMCVTLLMLVNRRVTSLVLRRVLLTWRIRPYSCVRRDFFLHVRHDSFIRATCLFMWHASFVCATWLIHTCATWLIHTCATRLFYTCDMPFCIYTRHLHLHIRHKPYSKSAPWPSHMHIRHMTHSYKCAVTQYAWHTPFKCATRLICICARWLILLNRRVAALPLRLIPLDGVWARAMVSMASC